MSTSISLDTRQTAFSLSNERVSRMMSGDKQTATHMGLWDKFKDLFRSEKKQEALNALFELTNTWRGPSQSFYAFNQLAQMATPNNRTLFTVAVSPEQDGYRLDYCISGHPVRTEQVTPAARDMILARMGQPTGAEHLEKPVLSLEEHRREVSPEQVNQLKDSDFGSGGVHKRFHAGTGVLQARDAIGREDFIREDRLQQYAESRPDLQHYISTQRQINAPQDANGKFAYAQVPLYDRDQINSRELDQALPTLTPNQAKSVAAQLVDMARAFYCNQLSHRDLHMQNLLVHAERKEDGAVFLKAIDFGRAKFDAAEFEPERFNDVDYLFDRQGCSLAETVGRNYLAGKDSAVAQKHYPLHKLLERFNHRGADVTETLSGIGARLKADLQMAGGDAARIDQAFECASGEVQMAFGWVARPQ
ncbi:hypothetical protein CXB49_01585 [Chromobacterium sp. ATCC 53434]|uniref:hypothetical protein n=1 Tax=Chromobacterium sp. (strain ATCC 53434 / SC 14030) TaxID=2059672 RepID=UPI000C7874CD|nr:hypothetical protein [Chromobacterium sp. ATCC 53434]AUH49618.1 hypothetical protein CXB49_01585 [Chromobacterium sp. ATCC 53434]